MERVEQRYIKFTTEKYPNQRIFIGFDVTKEFLEDLKEVYGIDLVNKSEVDFGIIAID